MKKYLVPNILILLIIISVFYNGKTVDVAKINDLGTALAKVEEELVRLEEELESRNDLLNSLDKDYMNDYITREVLVQTLSGIKWFTGEMPLKMYPYSDALTIAEGVEAPVDVISLVSNNEEESWALVKLIGPVNLGINIYGYIKVDYIQEARESSYPYSSFAIPISINGITVGDPVEKVIASYGKGYIEYRGFKGGFIHYGGIIQDNDGGHTLPGIDVFIDRQNKKVYGIRVEKEGYKTDAGFGVGSNALEAVNYYKQQFKMNTNKKISSGLEDTAFDIGNDFFLEFHIDTEELEADSVITKINIFPYVFIYG